ncbi:MAG: cell division protein FtsQ/DivIB [Acidimicrobiia bacterium]
MSAPPSPRVARRRRLAVVVGALLVVGTAAWMVSRSPLLDVDHVVVQGNARVAPEEILASSGVAPGDAMVWLDRGGAARAIEALPWIRTAQVHREWPGTVDITVRERVAVGWVDAGDGRALVVDGAGRALEVDAAAPPGLPELLEVAPAPVGASISPSGGAWLAGHLTTDELAAIRSISVVDQHATLVVTSGQEVRFGRLTQVGQKMLAAIAVLLQPGIGTATYIDVSAPSTPVAG